MVLKGRREGLGHLTDTGAHFGIIKPLGLQNADPRYLRFSVAEPLGAHHDNARLSLCLLLDFLYTKCRKHTDDPRGNIQCRGKTCVDKANQGGLRTPSYWM